jgi:hypothetical protein
MVTIAFAFIVQHGTIEWRTSTAGSNGLMGIPPPSIGALIFSEREMAMLAVVARGRIALRIPPPRPQRLGHGDGGGARRRTRRALDRPQSGDRQDRGIFPIRCFHGLAGGIFAPLLMFVAPDSFPFSQSILFLFAVIVGGAGWTFGPVVGALVSVVLPELLSGLAEYRLLFFGAALLVILWVAPEGVLGLLARLWPRRDSAMAVSTPFDVGAFLTPAVAPGALEVRDLGITFGGIKAATAVTFTAPPGKVTSVIGPNGAGKTTVLNLIGGFYRPDSGSIRLGERELAGPRGLEGGARRHRAHLSDHQAVRHHEHRRQRADRVAARPARQHGGRRRIARRSRRRRGAARLRRLSRIAVDAGGRPPARRSPAGRDSTCAGHASARAAAR